MRTGLEALQLRRGLEVEAAEVRLHKTQAHMYTETDGDTHERAFSVSWVEQSNVALKTSTLY